MEKIKILIIVFTIFISNQNSLFADVPYYLDFKKLWLSHKAKNEVKFIRKSKCFCTHECFNIVNILFNPKFYPKIIKTSKLIK